MIRGILGRIVVVQVDGTADGFTFDLYTAEIPAGAAEDTFPDVDDDTLSPAVFKIRPTITVAALATTYEDFDKQYGYEVNELAGEGRRRTTLYAKVRPAGTGTKFFDVGYTIDPPSIY